MRYSIICLIVLAVGALLEDSSADSLATRDSGTESKQYEEKNATQDCPCDQLPEHAEWTECFGSGESSRAGGIAQTSDGGYIIVGAASEQSNYPSDVYLVKIDPFGIIEWERLLGGSRMDIGNAVQQTSDGGYIIAGGTMSYGAGSLDVYLIKTDCSGIPEWEKAYGGTGWDRAWDVVQAEDGGYIAIGQIDSLATRHDDVYILKTDSNGELEWQKSRDWGADDSGKSICRAPDGEFVVLGYAEILNDVYLAKIDLLGNVRWERMFDIAGKGSVVASCVEPTRDGGYIIGGQKNEHILVIKTDGLGLIQWQKTFDSVRKIAAYSIWQAWDGGYMIAGDTYGPWCPDLDRYLPSYIGCGADLYCANLDDAGNLLWEENLECGTSESEALSMAPSSDGAFILAGVIALDPFYDQFDVLLMKLLPEGIQYGFDTGAEGWDFSGKVANLDQPSSTALGEHIGLSPDGSANSFSYWQSPGVFIERGKAYRARCTAGTNAVDLNRAPDFRIRANAEGTWQYWDTGVCTFDTGSTKSVELFMLPELQATSGTMAVNLDLTSFNPQDDLSSWIYLENVRLDIITVTSSSTELVRFTFDTGAEGWQYAGKIAGFDKPSSAVVSGHLGLSPAGSAHCFSYWNSPAISLAPGKIYQVCWTVESDVSDPNRAPEIRLRANQPSTWRSWETGVPSCGGISPSSGSPKTFGMIIQPDGDAATQTLYLSFDLLNFDPADEAHGWVYLDGVAIREVTIAP
jgi:hypothetical protein